MYKKYNTLTEVKEHLPEILDRIDTCRQIADSLLLSYRLSCDFCVYNSCHEDQIGTQFTTLDYMKATYDTYEETLDEIEYLNKLLDLIIYAKTA